MHTLDHDITPSVRRHLRRKANRQERHAVNQTTLAWRYAKPVDIADPLFALPKTCDLVRRKLPKVVHVHTFGLSSKGCHIEAEGAVPVIHRHSRLSAFAFGE